jgi:hypothetical protein
MFIAAAILYDKTLPNDADGLVNEYNAAAQE